MAKGRDRHRVVIENQEIDITNPDKLLWPSKGITKLNYLKYLIEVSPHLLKYLSHRALTVIRYPNGVDGEAFYQKSCPAYAPSFVKTYASDDINYIVCSDLPTLIWLGNQGAIDLHTPFNKINSNYPSEILLDLDPPSKEEFILSVEAALIIKEVFDSLDIISFIKTSGNKGLQIYIPIPDNSYTYDETRLFTEFLANFLTSKEPKWFTTERLKKNRGKRLYVDYLQHAEGKTIIAPYSLRGNNEALVAAPLRWSEINHSLKPSNYPMEAVLERIEKGEEPFEDFQTSKEKQAFDRVLQWLKETLPTLEKQ